MSSNSWKAFVRLDKTFMHVVFDEGEAFEGSEPLRKYRSEPDLRKVRRSLCDTSSTQNMLYTILPAPLDDVSVQTSRSTNSGTTSAAGLDDVPNTPIDDPKLKHEDKQGNAPKKTRVRPCRGQRIRHQKYFERMKLMIDADPEGFSIHSVFVPPSLAPDSGYQSGVLAKLEAYKYQMMREREIEAILSSLKQQSQP